MSQTLIWIAFFASVFGMYYVYLTNRNKERMALIEKGADAGLFYSEKERQTFNWSKLILKFGMFLTGIALGIFLSALLSKTGFINVVALYFSMILFFGGLSLILSHIIDRKNN